MNPREKAMQNVRLAACRDEFAKMLAARSFRKENPSASRNEESRHVRLHWESHRSMAVDLLALMLAEKETGASLPPS
jgi:hypothetical protein